jgi:DNA-binding NarL/FixJ family response regulator
MSHKILIADDHGPVRRRVRTIVERAGFGVCGEATNGQDAIAKSRELLPDLVILDVSMPVMNGFEAMAEILQHTANVKILIYTVHAGDAFRQEALRLGAHGYVTKSAPENILIDEMNRVLGKLP